VKRLTFLALFGILLSGLLESGKVAGASPSEPSTQPQAKSAQDLIDDLADPDPQVRDGAAQKLTAIGLSARPALIAAAKEGDPRISPRAAEILLQLPWSAPGDPPLVRQMLVGYGQRPDEERRQVVARLPGVPGSGPALVRLMREDPSDNVAWFIARMLSRNTDEPTLRALRELDPANARPAALAMSGRAWLRVDRARAMDLLRQAIETDRQHATFDEGALDFAFDLLCGAAIEANKPADAAELRRRQAQRVAQLSLDENRSEPVLELFALHAEFGPLPGFEQDLQTFHSVLARPEALYALARSWDRAGQGLVGDAMKDAAFAVSSADPNVRFRTARFLADHDWTNAAETELRAVLTSAAAMDTDQRAQYQVSTYYQLAHLEADRGDEAGSADLLQSAQEVLEHAGGAVHAEELNLPDQIHTRRLRASRAARDDKAAAAHLKALLQSPNIEVDGGIEAYTYLRELGRDAEAEQVFARAYAAQRAQLQRDVNNPEELNNLAWLCARCNKNVAEAVDLATRAVYAMPERAGYLDTAAEAHFAAGQADEAVKLETQALALKPNDRFMATQLARFRAGAR
jgi:hypothetical protein